MTSILPAPTVLAEQVQETSLTDVANLYGVTEGGVSRRLNNGGYNSAGTPLTKRPAHPSYTSAPTVTLDETWMAQAVCIEADPEAFYPDHAGPGKRAREAEAKMICGECPVRLRCLEWALVWDAATAGESWGIHGGLNGLERDKLRKQRIGHSA